MDNELDLVLASLPPIAGGAPGILDDIWDVIQGLYRLITDPAATIVTPIADWVRVALSDLYTFEKILFEPHLLPETIAARVWSNWGLPIPQQIGNILWLLVHRIVDPIILWFRDLKEHVTARVIGIRDDIYNFFRYHFARGYEFERERLWGWIPDWAQYHFPPVSPDTSLWAYIGRLILMPPFAMIGATLKVRDAIYDWFTGHFARGYEFELDRIGYLIPDQWRGHFPRPSPDTSLWTYIGRLIMMPPMVIIGEAIKAWQSFYDIMRDWYVGIYNGELEQSYPWMTDEEKRKWAYLPLDASFWTAVKKDAQFTTMRMTAGHRQSVAALKETGGDIKGFIQTELIDPLGDWTKSILEAVAEPGKRVWNWLSDKLRAIWERISEWWSEDAWPRVESAGRWIKTKFEGAVSGLTDKIEELLGLGSTITPEAAHGHARSLHSVMLAGVVGLGAMVTAGELLHPLKNMGLGRVAAMLWDQTNFALITGAYVGGIITASIRTPFTYYLQRHFRPFVPRAGDLAALATHRFISPDEWRHTMGYHGLPDAWLSTIERLHERHFGPGQVADFYSRQLINAAKFHSEVAWHGYEESLIEASRIAAHWRPRAQQLLRINQYLPLTNNFIEKQLRLGGLDPEDMEVFQRAIGMVWAKSAVKLFESSLQGLYGGGYCDIARVDDEWGRVLSFTTVDQWRHRSLELHREFSMKEDVVAVAIAAYKSGAIDEADAIDLLGRLGVDGTIAQVRMLAAKLGLLPRIRLVFPSEAGEPIPYE